MTASRRARQSGSKATISAPATSSVIALPPAVDARTLRPGKQFAHIRRRRSRRPSFLSASSADRLTASRTARSAQSALRPRNCASPRMYAAHRGSAFRSSCSCGGVAAALSSPDFASFAGRPASRAARPRGRRCRSAPAWPRRGWCRRHGRDVARVQDVGAGAGGARAARTTNVATGTGRREDRLDDVAHRGVEAAGRVHFQHDESRAFLRRSLHPCAK